MIASTEPSASFSDSDYESICPIFHSKRTHTSEPKKVRASLKRPFFPTDHPGMCNRVWWCLQNFPQRSLQSSRAVTNHTWEKNHLIMSPVKTGCWLPEMRAGQHIKQVPWWQNRDQKNERITHCLHWESQQEDDSKKQSPPPKFYSFIC